MYLGYLVTFYLLTFFYLLPADCGLIGLALTVRACEPSAELVS